MWGYCLLNQKFKKKIILFIDGRHGKICNTEIQQVSKHRRHFYWSEHKAKQLQIKKKAQSKPLWLEGYRTNSYQEVCKGHFPHPEYKICKLLMRTCKLLKKTHTFQHYSPGRVQSMLTTTFLLLRHYLTSLLNQHSIMQYSINPISEWLTQDINPFYHARNDGMDIHKRNGYPHYRARMRRASIKT